MRICIGGAPATLLYIGTEAFKACVALESIKITTNVLVIENYAFSNTPALVITLVYFEKDAHLAWLNGAGLGDYWNTDGNEIDCVYVMYLG